MIDFGVSCSCSYHVARRGTSFVRPFDGSYFLGRRCRRPFAAGDFFNLLYWWYNYLDPLINRVTLLFMSNKAGEVSLHCKLTWHKKLSAAAAAYNKICPRPEMLFTAAAAHVSERASAHLGVVVVVAVVNVAGHEFLWSFIGWANCRWSHLQSLPKLRGGWVHICHNFGGLFTSLSIHNPVLDLIT